MPIFFGSAFHSVARARTIRNVSRASITGTIQGLFGSRRGTRYLRTTAALPKAFSRLATSLPSCVSARMP